MRKIDKDLIDLMENVVAPKLGIAINHSELLDKDLAVVSLTGCDNAKTVTVLDATDDPDRIAQWQRVKDWLGDK